MKWGFWLLNGGLVLMIVSSLLPIGIIQGYASISEGLWYARSEEFMQQPLFDTLRWVRFRWRRCLHLRCTPLSSANLYDGIL